jgi:hypothetical protein
MRVLARHVFLKVLSAICNIASCHKLNPSKVLSMHHRSMHLQNQLKRRLYAITIASATCFLFPFAVWDTILVSTYRLRLIYLCGREDLHLITWNHMDNKQPPTWQIVVCGGARPWRE